MAIKFLFNHVQYIGSFVFLPIAPPESIAGSHISWSHDVCDCVLVLNFQYLLHGLLLVAADSPNPKA